MFIQQKGSDAALPLVLTSYRDLIYGYTKQFFDKVDLHVDLASILWTQFKHDITHGGGKWHPTILPLLTCQVVGGEVSDALPIAVAWNLLHLAAELLDDLQDIGAVKSVGRPLNPATAMNAATTLIFLAQLVLTKEGENCSRISPQYQQLWCELNQVSVEVCSGQHRDLTEGHTSNFTLDDYWKVSGSKSGSPLAWACRAGALLGGGTSTQVTEAMVFGYNLGMLGQIANDWIGFWQKDQNNDLALGKKTLPVLYALSILSGEKQNQLIQELDRACVSAATAAAVRTELICLGALHYVLAEAALRSQRAEAALCNLPAGKFRDFLCTWLHDLSPLTQLEKLI